MLISYTAVTLIRSGQIGPARPWTLIRKVSTNQKNPVECATQAIRGAMNVEIDQQFRSDRVVNLRISKAPGSADDSISLRQSTDDEKSLEIYLIKGWPPPNEAQATSYKKELDSLVMSIQRACNFSDHGSGH